MGSTGETRYTGSCICGETKYSFAGEPAAVGLCHCLNCRKLSASAFSTACLVPAPNFKIESDSALKSFTTKHHVEKFEMTPFFCGNCGTGLWKEAESRFPGLKIVLVGTLDGKGIEAKSMQPQFELWTQHRVPWVKALDVEQKEGFA